MEIACIDHVSSLAIPAERLPWFQQALYAYYNFRDELTVQEQLPVMKCIQGARESMFWPRMATEMKGYISKCDACMTHRTAPQNETLPPRVHTMPTDESWH